MTNLLIRLAQGVVVHSSELNISKADPNSTSVATVLHIIFGMAGAIAMVIIVVAGMRFVTSQGEPEKTNKARNSIIYAIVGLVVCTLAYGIVSFVARGTQ